MERRIILLDVKRIAVLEEEANFSILNQQGCFSSCLSLSLWELWIFHDSRKSSLKTLLIFLSFNNSQVQFQPFLTRLYRWPVNSTRAEMQSLSCVIPELVLTQYRDILTVWCLNPSANALKSSSSIILTQGPVYGNALLGLIWLWAISMLDWIIQHWPWRFHLFFTMTPVVW